MKLKEKCEGTIRSAGAACRLRDLQEKRVYRTRVLGVDRKVALAGVPRRLCWGDVVKGNWKSTGFLSSAGRYRVRDCGRRRGQGGHGGMGRYVGGGRAQNGNGAGAAAEDLGDGAGAAFSNGQIGLGVVRYASVWQG